MIATTASTESSSSGLTGLQSRAINLLIWLDRETAIRCAGGGRTPAAVVFVDSLARQPGSKRPGLLAQAGRGPAEFVARRILYTPLARAARDGAGKWGGTAGLDRGAERRR